MDQLKDKVIIITGSASGIGLATAHLALGQGAKVLGVDIATCPLALEKDPNFAFIQCNLTSESAPAEVVKKCLESFGERIDVLINVAGVLDQSGSVDTVTDAVWDRCLAVNLTAPVKLMREVIPIMKSQKGGSIVNMASKAGLSGAVAGVAYTASKHGLIGVTKNVAWRFKADNIRCNAVCPGGVTSGITNSIDRSYIDLEALETMIPVINSVKVKRPDFTLIRAEDVAQAIIFLASGHSPRISGAVLPVDDAWSTL